MASERPPRPIALRDGFPVEAATVADAGPYTPVPLPLTTRPVDVGEPLPSGTDAVLPFDAVTLSGYRAEAVAPIAAGEGVLPAGGDTVGKRPLRRAGEVARAVDIAVMRAAGIKDVTIRLPRIHVVWGGEARSPADRSGVGHNHAASLAKRAAWSLGARSRSIPRSADQETPTR